MAYIPKFWASSFMTRRVFFLFFWASHFHQHVNRHCWDSLPHMGRQRNCMQTIVVALRQHSLSHPHMPLSLWHCREQCPLHLKLEHLALLAGNVDHVLDSTSLLVITFPSDVTDTHFALQVIGFTLGFTRKLTPYFSLRHLTCKSQVKSLRRSSTTADPRMGPMLFSKETWNTLFPSQSGFSVNPVKSHVSLQGVCYLLCIHIFWMFLHHPEVLTCPYINATEFSFPNLEG